MGLAISSEPWWLYEIHGAVMEEAENIYSQRDIALTEHPGKCPSMNATPMPCDWCLKHYEDKYFLWRLTMAMDQPYDAENNPTV